MNRFPVEISYEGVKYSFTVLRQAPDAFMLSINGQVRAFLLHTIGRTYVASPKWSFHMVFSLLLVAGACMVDWWLFMKAFVVRYRHMSFACCFCVGLGEKLNCRWRRGGFYKQRHKR